MAPTITLRGGPDRLAGAGWRMRGNGRGIRLAPSGHAGVDTTQPPGGASAEVHAHRRAGPGGDQGAAPAGGQDGR